MGYGGRRYGHRKVESQPVTLAAPTFVCNHCGKIHQVTPKSVTLTCVANNALFLTGRICETCGKLLREWLCIKN